VDNLEKNKIRNQHYCGGWPTEIHADCEWSCRLWTILGQS